VRITHGEEAVRYDAHRLHVIHVADNLSENTGKLSLQVAKCDVLSAASVVLQAQNLVKSLTAWVPPGLCWGSSRRSPDPLIVWRGGTPPPQTPRSRCLWCLDFRAVGAQPDFHPPDISNPPGTLDARINPEDVNRLNGLALSRVYLYSAAIASRPHRHGALKKTTSAYRTIDVVRRYDVRVARAYDRY